MAGILRTTSTGETVEKVPKPILGGDTEKNDFTECATINDLIIMKGRETPKNQVLTILKGFSTVSEAILGPTPSDASEKGGLAIQKLTDCAIRIEEFKR